MKRSDRKAWRKKYDHVVTTLKSIRDHIDDLGEFGEMIEIAPKSGTLRNADTIACFASNGIEGTLSLLRELRERVLAEFVLVPAKRKARKRARRAR